jgi:hypothetical protein
MRETLFMTICAAVWLLGCGDDGDGGPGGPEQVDIGGVWSVTFSIADSAGTITCAGSGTINFDQTDSTFTGSYNVPTTCIGLPIPGSIPLVANISNGRITGNTLSFQDPACQFQGTVSGPPERINGSLACTVQFGTQTLSGTGTWQATR